MIGTGTIGQTSPPKNSECLLRTPNGISRFPENDKKVVIIIIWFLAHYISWQLVSGNLYR